MGEQPCTAPFPLFPFFLSLSLSLCPSSHIIATRSSIILFLTCPPRSLSWSFLQVILMFFLNRFPYVSLCTFIDVYEESMCDYQLNVYVCMYIFMTLVAAEKYTLTHLTLFAITLVIYSFSYERLYFASELFHFCSFTLTGHTGTIAPVCELRAWIRVVCECRGRVTG